MILSSEINIKALADLARVAITDEEAQALLPELTSILSFVEIIQSADVSGVSHNTSHRNVLREDSNPIMAGTYTESLLKAAPQCIDNKVMVQQVVARRK